MPSRVEERDGGNSGAGPSKMPENPSGSRRSSVDYSQLPPILPLSAFPEPAKPIHEKLSGYEFYRTTLKSPKRIVAPMVSGSELPWRLISRRYGADLCYSPMINARSLVDNLKAKGKTAKMKALTWFDVETQEEGYGEDSMLIVQLAGNDPQIILQAAQRVQDHCLAIDLNLGCPQHIAKRGNYGSFLQEDWPLIFRIINTLHSQLKVPVTAKMRVFPDVERTVAYAKMLAHAGAQIVTVHGRTREQKGHKTGLADWEKIKAVKEALDVPVFANGNILYREDIDACLAATGVDGVMSAEGNLYNPLVFATDEILDSLPKDLLPHRQGVESTSADQTTRSPWADFAYIPAVATDYLTEVSKCKCKVDAGAVKSHIFKICKPALEVHTDVRAAIGQARVLHGPEPGPQRNDVTEYLKAIADLDTRLMADREKAAQEGTAALSRDLPEKSGSPKAVPHWLLQPYFRPPLPEVDQNSKGAKANEAAKPVTTADGMVDTQDIQSAGEKRLLDDTPEAGGSIEGESKRLRRCLEEASTSKTQGNAHFTKARYDEAIASYQEALSRLPPRPQEPQDAEDDADSLDALADGSHASESEGRDDQEPSRKGKGKGKARDDPPVQSPATAVNTGSGSGIFELSAAELAEEARLSALSPEERQEEEELANLRSQITELRVTVHANTAACETKLERWQRAVEACDEALKDDPHHVKALHRRSVANEKLGTWSSLSSSYADLSLLLSSPSPSSSAAGGGVDLLQGNAKLRGEVRSSLARVGKKRDEAAQREKDEMLGKLKGIGDTILGKFGLSTNNFKFEQNETGGWGVKFQR